jgi:hypothetical protein
MVGIVIYGAVQIGCVGHSQVVEGAGCDIRMLFSNRYV